MEKPKPCPMCKSSDTETFEEDGFIFLRCKRCKYDESIEYDDAYPGQRNTQKGKSGYTPYKRGGAMRSIKR